MRAAGIGEALRVLFATSFSNVQAYLSGIEPCLLAALERRSEEHTPYCSIKNGSMFLVQGGCGVGCLMESLFE